MVSLNWRSGLAPAKPRAYRPTLLVNHSHSSVSTADLSFSCACVAIFSSNVKNADQRLVTTSIASNAETVTMIHVDSIWLATEPIDMRAGTETVLTRVVAVFSAVKPHCAYLFVNRCANRMKVLVHDGD